MRNPCDVHPMRVMAVGIGMAVPGLLGSARVRVEISCLGGDCHDVAGTPRSVFGCGPRGSSKMPAAWFGRGVLQCPRAAGIALSAAEPASAQRRAQREVVDDDCLPGATGVAAVVRPCYLARLEELLVAVEPVKRSRLRPGVAGDKCQPARRNLVGHRDAALPRQHLAWLA